MEIIFLGHSKYVYYQITFCNEGVEVILRLAVSYSKYYFDILLTLVVLTCHYYVSLFPEWHGD